MKPKLIGYVTANAGFLTNVSKDNIVIAGAGVGCKYEKNGIYGQAEAGYGTATYAKMEAGKDFTFSDGKFGVNTSVGGQYTSVNNGRYCHKSLTIIGDDSSKKANDTRGYGQIALTYKTPSFKASIGVRGGVKSTKQPDLKNEKYSSLKEFIGDNYFGRTTKSFVEPMANIGVNLGESWEIALQVAPSQSSLDLSLNF